MFDGEEQRLGSQYVLDERIGRGAMGTVWRGRDTDTGQPVAVKILAEELCEDPDVLARFVQERTVLIGIRHPNLVAVHDMVVERRRLALIMDLVSGGDLQRRLRSEGVLAPDAAAGLTVQICAALQAIHAAGVVHRDLKPANVLLELTGAEPLVRLADFGVARIADRSRITARTSIVGTPSYLAPELIRGEEPFAASDVYALGITLYELLAGRPPFDGGPVLAVLHRHLEDAPPRPPGIADSLWAVIEACLGKDSAGRPDAATVADLVGRARPGLAGLPAITSLPPLPPLANGVPGAEEAGQTGSVIYAMPATFYGSDAGRSPNPLPASPSLPPCVAQVAAGADDSTMQIPVVRTGDYGPPTSPRLDTPRQGEMPVPFSPPPAFPPVRNVPAPGPFDDQPSDHRRKRRTAVIAASAAAVLLVSGAVALAVTDNSPSAPTAGQTDSAPTQGAAETNQGGALAVSSGSSPSAVATTASATPSASASASATASATASRSEAAGPGSTPTATPTATATSAPPVVDLALDKPVTVSSTVSSNPIWSPAHLTDGVLTYSDSNHGWSSGAHSTSAVTEWASVDLGSALQIDDVNLSPRQDGIGSCFPAAFTIAVSTDGEHWTAVVAEANYPKPGEATQRFSFAKTAARYVKVTATTLSPDAFGNYYFQLQQISIY